MKRGMSCLIGSAALGVTLYGLSSFFVRHEAEIKDLESIITAKDQEIERLNETVISKDEQAAVLCAQVTKGGDLRAELARSTQALRACETRNAVLISERDELRRQVAAAEVSLATVRGDQVQALALIRSLRDQIDAQNLAIQQVQEEKGELGTRLAALHETELKHQEERCAEHIADLASRVEVLDRENGQVRRQNAFLRSGRPTPSTRPVDVGVYTYGVVDNTRASIEYWPKDMTNGTDSEGYPVPPAGNQNWPKRVEFTTAHSDTSRPCFMINGIPSDSYMYIVSELDRGAWTRRFASWFVVTDGRNVSTLTRPDGTTFELSTQHGQMILHRNTWSVRDGTIAENRSAMAR